MDVIAFFNELHWSVRYPAKALAAIGGGYVSNHPELFPSWAVIVGGLVALWVALAFLWQLLNAWREHKGKSRLSLDPNLIIIVCLAGALGVAVWQSWRGTPSRVVGGAAHANQFPAPADTTLFVPKLGTQTAKEDFQKAINDLSLLVRQVDEIVKISAPIAGNRPLVRKDLNGADEPLSKLQQARDIYRSAHEQLIGGGEGEFFKKFSLSQKRALLSILPQGSQATFDKYNRELWKVTVALLLVQDAERHKDDGAMYQRTITNAEFLADDFRLPISELHDWVNVMNQRIDQMSNSI